MTLWLTREAAARLKTLTRRDRISQRAALQSALEAVHLFGLSPERRDLVVPECSSADLERAVAMAWECARDLTHRRGKDRIKFVVPYDEESLTALRGTRIGRGLPVSLSSAVSTVFLQWPAEDDGIRRAKRCVWSWALPRAQARSDAARLGEPGPGFGEGLLASAS